MARLVPINRLSDLAKGTSRFSLDTDALENYFGGAKEVPELCRQFGLPHYRGNGKYRAAQAVILLELADRMGRPILDVRPYIVQVR